MPGRSPYCDKAAGCGNARVSIEEYTQKYPKAVLFKSAKGAAVMEIDLDDESKAPVVGTAVKAGKAIGYVQTYYGREEIISAIDGRIVAVTGKQGKNVAKGEIVAFVQ